MWFNSCEYLHTKQLKNNYYLNTKSKQNKQKLTNTLSHHTTTHTIVTMSTIFTATSFTKMMSFSHNCSQLLLFIPRFTKLQQKRSQSIL